MVPATGVTKRETALNSVVLPAPFGPMTPTIWLARTFSETPSRATTPSKRTSIPATSSTVGVVSGVSPDTLQRPVQPHECPQGTATRAPLPPYRGKITLGDEGRYRLLVNLGHGARATTMLCLVERRVGSPLDESGIRPGDRHACADAQSRASARQPEVAQGLMNAASERIGRIGCRVDH